MSGSCSGCCRVIVVMIPPAGHADPSVIFKTVLLKNEMLCGMEHACQVQEKQSIWINTFRGPRSLCVSSPCSVPGWAADLIIHGDRIP